MAETLDQLAQRVIFAIGEVEGTSVQTYSEPRVKEALKQIFAVVIRKLWWPEYMQWFERTLDGTLGIVTSNLTGIAELRDIRVILPELSRKPLNQLPPNYPPQKYTGTTPLYYESLNTTDANFLTRRLQFWPKTATGNVYIHARLVPPLVDSTAIYLQSELLVFGAAWLILEAEDVNPNAAALMERMFGEMYSGIVKNYQDQPIENPVGGMDDQRYLTQWFGEG